MARAWLYKFYVVTSKIIPPDRAHPLHRKDYAVQVSFLDAQWIKGPEKAHKHLAHKQFLGHPGHRSSRPGTRFLPAGYPDENVYVPWVPHTAHKLLTPGHRSGEPPPPPHPVGRPPPARAVTGKICLCLCAFSFPELWSSYFGQVSTRGKQTW